LKTLRFSRPFSFKILVTNHFHGFINAFGYIEKYLLCNISE